MCDSSETGGLCPDTNLKSSYYCFCERESDENNLQKRCKFSQKKEKEGSAQCDTILLSYLSSSSLKSTQLPPVSALNEEGPFPV